MNADRIAVLMYHRVAQPLNAWEQRMAVSPERFRAHMLALKQQGYQAVSMDQFWAWHGGQAALPAKSFVLTFDDGYLDVYEHAAPVLAALRWPATLFLVSSLIGRQDEWCAEENPSGALYPLMDAAQIRQLVAQGFSFYSHSRSHADLPALPDEALANQLRSSKLEIEALLGQPVPFLAYPFGRHDERVVAASKQAGYAGCFSVIPGFNRPGQDPYRIRRLDITNFDTPKRLLRKLALGTNDGRLRSSLRYYVAALAKRAGIHFNQRP